MTRLKVFDSQTNNTYYLNNVDVSCAKLHSYIGVTANKSKILHKPLAHLEYSTDYSYKTDVDKLNALYNHDLSADFNGYFPANHGIILSELLIDKISPMNYITNRIDCAELSLTETTYWCPPIIKRDSSTQNNKYQSTRVISFSYIYKNLYETVLEQHHPTQLMIYNNTTSSYIQYNNILGIFPYDGYTSVPEYNPKYYCSSGAIGVHSIKDNKPIISNSCIEDCSGSLMDSYISPCKNYNDFFNVLLNKQKNMYNELVIKSWNYNPDSNMSNRGIIYNASMDKWVAQTPNPESPWGWNDVSNLSKNENIPLLAFGITIPDKSNPTKDDISNIKHLYADLSNNLEPSFNEYRKKKSIPLMPYRIGLDISCLTRPDCSNPFFDLSLILNTAPPGPTPKICCTKQCGHGGCSSDCCVGMFGAGCSMISTCNCSC